VSTFITRMDADGPGTRLAVKDIIDVEGVPTTGGSRALERRALPAGRDAACLAGAREAGARIVGKATCMSSRCCRSGPIPGSGRPSTAARIEAAVT
jgi:Asp-tRNA(Asn)/Glu-tRNA(Gln) amidotransferase A subunit family amidase